jgi:hypothetical protein
MWFKHPPIEVFVRHCHYSEVSRHKARPVGFTREKAYHNLLQTINPRLARLTFFLDTHFPMQGKHFVAQQKRYPVVEIQAGTEAGSFLRLLDHIMAQNFKPDTIVYLVEDDYLHREGWCEVLLEGLGVPGADYVTLYDHKDKYFLPQYDTLRSRVFHTRSCHWRTTPSTTNTFAARFATLRRDKDLQRAFSLDRKISCDHDKFCALAQQGAILISPIPGWSTHAEPAYASPCVDWSLFLS